MNKSTVTYVLKNLFLEVYWLYNDWTERHYSYFVEKYDHFIDFIFKS